MPMSAVTAEMITRSGKEALGGLLRMFMQNCPIGLAIADRDGRFLSLNAALASQLATTVDTLLDGSDPRAAGLAAKLLAVDPRTLQRTQPIVREVTLERPDGEMIALVWHFPLGEAEGEVQAIGSLVLDITERKRLEEQLAHAQKMEAVGRLTGGIAHDYNNMLGVIAGNLELLDLELAEDSPLRDFTKSGLRAVDRSADLTHRLLAFARRHPMRPKVLDLGELVRNLQKLLVVTLGTKIDVRIDVEDGRHPALIDSGQLENALLNLGINSRDAMPNGGTFVVRVESIRADKAFAIGRAEVSEGSYVRIIAADTGEGMSAETLAKATEPFFTTKGDRGGTGLGLSMVQGFAAQSGGIFAIDSQPSRGTEVRLYLPQVEAELEVAAPDVEGTSAKPGGSRRILVLEDNSELGRTVATMLTGLGHDVLLSEDPLAALEIIRNRSDIDILLTEVMLPGSLSGVHVARRARDENPQLGIILATGYAEASPEGALEFPADLPLLHKPFRLAALDRAIREAGGARPGEAADIAAPTAKPPPAPGALDPTIIVDRSFLNRCAREVRELFGLWERLKGEALLPVWSSLDPFAIMPFLDSATLVEVRHQPLDFVYRASGRTEIEARGYDPAGRTVGEWHFGSTRDHVLASYRYVATARSFLFDWETAVAPTDLYIEDQTLFLPFTVTGEKVDKILIYSRLTRRRPRDSEAEAAT